MPFLSLEKPGPNSKKLGRERERQIALDRRRSFNSLKRFELFIIVLTLPLLLLAPLPFLTHNFPKRRMVFPGSSTPDGNDKSEGSAQLQDIEWLSSLSEPELDFLISLKELAIRRAKNAGYKDLGGKFDLRMLRTLGFILLEFFKERVQSTFDIPDSAEILRLLNQSGLSFLDSEGKPDSNSSSQGTNDLSFVSPIRKRMWEGVCEETAKCKKRQKIEGTDR